MIVDTGREATPLAHSPAARLLLTLIIGQEIPTVVKGPMTTAHIMRWSAAMENWHRIHYDVRYATEHDKLPDVLVNGSWKQHVMVQLLTDWVGETGWLWKVSFQFRGMNVPGDTLTAWGRVVRTEERGRYGVVDLEIGLRNQKGDEGTPGTARVVLPRNNGPAVPYPFDPGVLGEAKIRATPGGITLVGDKMGVTSSPSDRERAR